jgi:hypothetical protein
MLVKYVERILGAVPGVHSANSRKRATMKAHAAVGALNSMGDAP